MTRMSKNLFAFAVAAGFGLAPVAGLADSQSMQAMDAIVNIDDVEWMPMAEGSPVEISFLWGDPATGPVGFLIRLPARFEEPIHKHSSNYHAVIIQGTHRHWTDGEDPAAAPLLGPGSYFSQVAEEFHGDANAGDEPVIGYVHFDGPLDSIPKE